MSSAIGLRRSYQEARWGDDLDPTGAETDSDLESLEQDVVHILAQVLGSNLADPEKGVGAVNYLNGTTVQLEAMPAIIDSQLAEVSRITTSHTTLLTQSDGSFLVEVEIQVGTDIVNLQFAVGPNGLSRQ
jgi:hypothetical protein